jgi:hypothetical protein
VTFTAPANGAGGTFSGKLTATVTTDNDGLATAPALTANGTIGNYNVVANLGASSVSFNLTNTQGLAQVTLINLTQVYDGSPKNAAAMTVPSGLPVTLTYDGSLAPPTNASSYQVTAIVAGQNYSGQANGTLSISKADQAINFGALPNRTIGEALFALSAIANSGLAVNFSVVSGPAAISGNMLTLTGSASVLVRAAQAGNGNYNSAASVDRSFDVSKAQATITLSNLNQHLRRNGKDCDVHDQPGKPEHGDSQIQPEWSCGGHAHERRQLRSHGLFE